MKRFLWLLVGFLLVACSGPAAAPANVAGELVVEEAAAGEAAAPHNPAPTTAPGALYPYQDLTLVGSTGRPQFINAYVNW